MDNDDKDGKLFNRCGGAFFGLIVGCLVVGAYVLNLSKAEFHDTSKIGLLSTVLGFVVIGAVFGVKFIENVLDWFSWF
ncbi:hypothetical protein L4X63_23490 [Geomonas sp. Red32]|uniref:hypothetical protein n=1 Tax=Geomonas sp. Red32 TaxID=2912856 RepID=UPI00202CCE7B|nr:hypothetical protein [Geomonas sp. Red32]MCM0084542.1 hypothetical protein [Geomonas sp. Red32]